MRKVSIDQIKKLDVPNCKLIFFCPTTIVAHKLLSLLDYKGIRPAYRQNTCTEAYLGKYQVEHFLKGGEGYAYYKGVSLDVYGIIHGSLRVWKNSIHNQLSFYFGYEIVEIVLPMSNLDL